MRIFGVNIPDDKQISVSLTYLYGIGLHASNKVLSQAGIKPNKKTKDLTSEEAGKIQGLIEKSYRIEGDLRQKVRQNIQRLKDLKTYRGMRHARRLPSRGQRTRTNSRTIRGNVRHTAGSGKRKVDLK